MKIPCGSCEKFTEHSSGLCRDCRSFNCKVCKKLKIRNDVATASQPKEVCHNCYRKSDEYLAKKREIEANGPVRHFGW